MQTKDHNRVLNLIKVFTEEFRDCQCVMTCRIAAREYTFEQFTEVEIADFNEEQIRDFAKKWFRTKKDNEKGKNFIKQLQDNKPIQELATNPLLLTLLCLVFGEANDFPHNRSELYKEGLDVLLKKWDAKRNIERDQVYKKLSLKRKEDLLSQLAYQTFEQGDYFFKQQVVETKIIEYIRNLQGANEDEEALQLDSEAVLKSIEAQHGLLVERARGIYSFSHLTFHEYFTAKQITSPTSKLSITLENLVKHCFEKRYREVFFLVVGILPEADEFFRLLKSKTDRFIADEPELQDFLAWVRVKARSVKADHKSEAIRAFYLALALALASANNLAFANASDLDLASASASVSDLALDLELTFNHTLSLARASASNLALAIASASDLDLASVLANDLACASNLALASASDLALDLALNLNLAIASNLSFSLDSASALVFALDRLAKIELLKRNDPETSIQLKSLKSQIPDGQNSKAFTSWWKTAGKLWTENLRAVMVNHRNIGHDWQFTTIQTDKLRQYFNANKLLAECLNSDCYVAKATREEILSSLLLPMSELETQ